MDNQFCMDKINIKIVFEPSSFPAAYNRNFGAKTHLIFHGATSLGSLLNLTLWRSIPAKMQCFILHSTFRISPYICCLTSEFALSSVNIPLHTAGAREILLN